MFSDKRYIVYVYVYQKQVVYAHVRKVKFPKTIRHTSEYLRICKVGRTSSQAKWGYESLSVSLHKGIVSSVTIVRCYRIY